MKNIEFSNTSVQTVPSHLFSQTKSTTTESEYLIKPKLCFSLYPVLSFDFDCTNNIINTETINIVNMSNKLSLSEFNSINIQPKINKPIKSIQKKIKNTIKPKQAISHSTTNNMKVKKNKIENPSFQQPKTKTKPKTFHTNTINTIKNTSINKLQNNKENENENSLDLIKSQSIIINGNDFIDEDDDDEFSVEKGYRNGIYSDEDDLINEDGDELSLLNDESYSEGNTSMVMSLWDLVSEIENDMTN